MFYLNSKDKGSIPNSLFFLHRLGLLEHRTEHKLPADCLYLLDNDKAQQIFTLSDIQTTNSVEKTRTVLISDFLSEDHYETLHGHHVIVLPHVYFDYVSMIKSLYTNKELGSLQILVPHTKNNLLIPKKHLMLTLSFLQDSDFIARYDFNEKSLKESSSDSVVSNALALSLTKLKSMLSIILYFLAKPMVHVRLFFAKYNVKFVFGKIRVLLIKAFYWMINQRFSLKRSFSLSRQFAIFTIQQLFYYLPRRFFGYLKVVLIKSWYSLINLRFTLISLFHRILNLRFDFLALLGFLKVASIKLFYAAINFRFTLIGFFHRILNLRFDFLALLGFLKVSCIKLFYAAINFRFTLISLFHRILNLRFDFLALLGFLKVASIKLFYAVINLRFLCYSLFYKSIHLFGLARVASIKLFYAVINLRFAIFHSLSRFYWFNFKYTLFPLRKVYWVLENEINKRVLSKFSNATKN